MKKPSREKNGAAAAAIQLENRHPGCMWGGILHVLNYNYHWRYVKKRLPLSRFGYNHGYANFKGGTNKVDYSDTSRNQTDPKGDNIVVDRKKTPSIISRLKSLVVVEDRWRRKKGQPQHHRRSTYRAPAQPSLPTPNPNSALQTETEDNPPSTDSAATNRDREQLIVDSSNKTIRPRRHSADTAFYDPKKFIDDALTLTNINEALLEKMVRERRPPPLNSLQKSSFSSREELKRCGTFPSPRLSELGVSVTENNAAETFALPMAVVPRIKRFTDIKDKIKYVTALPDKKEKQRIAMDGVLDKIPKDREVVSDETKREMFGKWTDFAASKKEITRSKSGRRYFKRTVSLDESNMDKYCQLFKRFNIETKHNDMNITSDVLKPEEHYTTNETSKRSFNRILSLPNFESFSFRSEDSARSSTDLYEIGSFDREIEAKAESENNDPNPEENVDGSEQFLITEDSEPESGISNVAKKDDSDNLGGGPFIRTIQVRSKDLDLFNYVNDVLDLSGLTGTGTDILTMWYSDDQPVDPAVFDEVEFHSPKCNDGYIGSENHLLCIFDLINEVLIEISQRSVTYWPVPLTKHCHVHPMPFGYRVVEDVWSDISSYIDPTPDDFRELQRSDGGWMNLQFESECIGLELDELMFEDLLEDLIFDNLLEDLIISP